MREKVVELFGGMRRLKSQYFLKWTMERKVRICVRVTEGKSADAASESVVFLDGLK